MTWLQTKIAKSIPKRKADWKQTYMFWKRRFLQFKAYHRFLLEQNSLFFNWQIHYLHDDGEMFRQTQIKKKCWNRIKFRWHCVGFPYDFFHVILFLFLKFRQKIVLVGITFVKFAYFVNFSRKCSYLIDLGLKTNDDSVTQFARRIARRITFTLQWIGARHDTVLWFEWRRSLYWLPQEHMLPNLWIKTHYTSLVLRIGLTQQTPKPHSLHLSQQN